MIRTIQASPDASDIRRFADRIADDFGEVDGRKILRRLARVLGPETLAEFVCEAQLALAAESPVTRRLDGSPRTKGGVLLKIAKGWVVGQLRMSSSLPKGERQRLYRAMRLLRSPGTETAPDTLPTGREPSGETVVVPAVPVSRKTA